jgi:hypothetical protein
MRTADIKQGIIDAIAEAFPDATIYAEKVPQNFEDGSFRVKTITATNRAELGTRRWREVLFNILYFPKSTEEAEAEWELVRDRLFDAVEWITVAGDKMRGADLSGDYDAEQEVGHVNVTFGAFLIEGRGPGIPTMETLETTGGLNNG